MSSDFFGVNDTGSVATFADFYGPGSSDTSRTSEERLLPTGVDTSYGAMSSPQGAVAISTVFEGLRGSIFGKPLTWLFGLILVLVAWKLIEETRGGKEAFTKIRVDGTNMVKIGLMAMIFFVIAKFFATRYDVPGLSAFVRSA